MLFNRPFCCGILFNSRRPHCDPFCNPIAAYLIVRLFRHPVATGADDRRSLAQTASFSFILAALGVEPENPATREARLILAGAILSILVNPLYFAPITRLKAKFQLVEPSGNLAVAAKEEEKSRPTTRATTPWSWASDGPHQSSPSGCGAKESRSW